MNADAFIDTNILLYTIDDDPASRVKRDASRAILLSQRWGWSVQIAAEFFVNATSPKRPVRLTSEMATRCLEVWMPYPIVPITVDIFHRAVELHSQFRLSYWDAAILAAAGHLGCRIVYSEDMAHGQDYAGIQVINPFTVFEATAKSV